jgi:hypothetical protein
MLKIYSSDKTASWTPSRHTTGGHELKHPSPPHLYQALESGIYQFGATYFCSTRFLFGGDSHFQILDHPTMFRIFCSFAIIAVVMLSH